MRFHRGSHCLYKTEYHVVWTPRYRRKIFVKGVKEYFEKSLTTIGLDADIEVVTVNAQPDHVHLVIIIPPRVAVANVIQFIKSHTGSLLKAKFPFLKHMFYGRDGIWSRGYCVSGIGFSEKEIIAYVTYQEKEDKGQLKLEF